VIIIIKISKKMFSKILNVCYSYLQGNNDPEAKNVVLESFPKHAQFDNHLTNYNQLMR